MMGSEREWREKSSDNDDVNKRKIIVAVKSMIKCDCDNFMCQINSLDVFLLSFFIIL